MGLVQSDKKQNTFTYTSFVYLSLTNVEHVDTLSLGPGDKKRYPELHAQDGVLLHHSNNS